MSPAIMAGSLNVVNDVDIGCDSNLTVVTFTFAQRPDYSSCDRTNPPRLIIDIANVGLPTKPLGLAYCRPVERIDFQRSPADSIISHIVLEYLEGFDYSIRQSANSIVVEFPLELDSREENHLDFVQPSWFDREINLVVDGGQVSSALNLIAKKAEFDIVISDLNDTQIWVNFQKVRAGDALQTILSSSGNSYYTSGDVVVVTNESTNIKNGLETRVYDLKYQYAEDLKDVIKGILSAQGNIEIAGKGGDGTAEPKGRSRTLLITDTKAKHKIIDDVIAKIDHRPQQISISVKFIETNITDEKSLGMDWSKIIETQLTGADPFGINEGSTEAPPYSAYSPWPPKKSTFEYGTLTISEAKAVLNYLHDSGDSRLLSDPSITTSDGKKATISVTTTIPIQTINRFSEGAVIQDIVTYEFKEVGIILNVTPYINEQGRITLSCEPQVEEITGWVGPSDNQQPITTKRSVKTDIVVVNGETVVIGGLYKEGEIKNESKIWLLGDLPLLGWLFKTENTVKNKTDLLIFITPEILE